MAPVLTIESVEERGLKEGDEVRLVIKPSMCCLSKGKKRRTCRPESCEEASAVFNVGGVGAVIPNAHSHAQLVCVCPTSMDVWHVRAVGIYILLT